jgi:hypothetical protein
VVLYGQIVTMHSVNQVRWIIECVQQRSAEVIFKAVPSSSRIERRSRERGVAGVVVVVVVVGGVGVLKEGGSCARAAGLWVI